MNISGDLAGIVRFHRKKAGLTQAGLAKLAGLGKSAVFEIERGKTTAQLDTIGKILGVLNIGVEFTGPLMNECRRAIAMESNG